ncbi:hypothetical protein [Embleya hyalina]|uniref:Uncharacterized protein n=1 Tax=Embleya hyalina TaxID=516124 RepID=A0A401YZ21_9ACTN|nr:hypothetical protein [Embleya hyalina]GCD99745.1 hypothetical protein EHYA_07467 [Embleya hyalina]
MSHEPWADDRIPPPPEPLGPLDDEDEEIGITPCRCAGEGCDACDNTGVVYP